MNLETMFITQDGPIATLARERYMAYSDSQ